MNFHSLGISAELDNVLRQNGITEPTPVQEQAIPLLMSGKDIIAQAQTGTGKTFAFLLPIMEKVDIKNVAVQALVITPTRELAVQVAAEARKIAPVKKINILAAYGGQDVEQQARKLKGAIHLIIGTPGRLLDHLRRKTVNLNQLSLLVLDEADQMLDMGFLPDIEQIIKQAPDKRQTMLFSATMPDQIRSLASKYMREPVQVKVQSKNITLDQIRQIAVETTDRSKQDALCKAIDEYNPFLAIVFCRTKRRASVLNSALQRRGYKSDELHGDLTQAKREKVMKAFRQAKTQLLVATDVAARGLDIEGVTHVFNYDIPEHTESYIHRIGRTGRAGEIGTAITFVAPKDRRFLNAIEKAIKSSMEKRRIEAGEMPKHKEGMSRVVEERPKGRFAFRGPKKRKGKSIPDKKAGHGYPSSIKIKHKPGKKTAKRVTV